MKLSFKLLYVFLVLFSCALVTAQDVVAKKGSYVIDKENRIIVWYQSDLDAVSELKTVTFDDLFKLENTLKKTSYTNAIKASSNKAYKLYVSDLPIVHMTLDVENMTSKKKIPGFFTYYDADKYLESTIGVRHRGNLSLSFAKKSFDLEFWKDATSKEKIDVQFGDLRSDDDWILDAMFNEPLRLRSYISTNIWTELHKPYYLQNEPKAKSGFGVNYVEVFKNNVYYGVYQLSESIDRKQLKLKKNDSDTIRGQLFKANSYSGGPDFTRSPEFKNIFPHWNGWKTEYPFLNYESHFEDIFSLENLVVNASDADFIENIGKKLNLTNAIDYYLFVNVIRASDNLGKNYYLAKYDDNAPFFFVPWDVDGVMGIIQDGKQINTTTDILSNGLFDRLIKLNPDDYKAKVKARWHVLRATVFSNKTLVPKVDKGYSEFTKNGIYEREQLVWQSKLSETPNDAHLKYLKTWLKNRLSFLDTHFENL